MFTTIIVDRVGNTNVFNVIRNETGRQIISENNSLQSITDDDLIQEYLKELVNIAQVSRSIAMTTSGEKSASAFHHMDVNRRLHQIGETFYRQFFPSALQDFFRDNGDEYVYFHIDPKLASIPLEILSTGKNFLWEKFYIGKSVKGSQTSSDYLAKDKLNMLIIADPTEDLEWARREGEQLFEHLNTNFPEKKLQLELISGRHITKLSLLNDIVGKDIIHYSGHLHYTNDTQENGWLLYDNKIIHAREIQKSGATPLLIFSNSCVSGRHLESLENKTSWYENFAGSFLKSGKTNYVGTVWELPDTHQTLKFCLEFFDNIFQGYPVGYSLHKARMFAKENFGAFDLTWASYLLMGSPLSKVFQKESKIPDLSRNTLDSEMVFAKYPYPVALAYFGVYELSNMEKSRDQGKHDAAKFEKLYDAYENTLLFVSALIFSNYKSLNIEKPLIFDPKDVAGTVDATRQALNIIGVLKTEILIPNLGDTMNTHKDEIYKIIGWKQQYDRGEIHANHLEGYVISLQYLLERLLIDIEYLKNYGFFKIKEPGYAHLSLYGLAKYHAIKEITLPTQTDENTFKELTIRSSALTGKCIFYIPVKRVFLDMSPFLDLNTTDEKNSDSQYPYVYKKYDTGKPLPVIIKGRKPGVDSPRSNTN
jgi:hypothetical protein